MLETTLMFYFIDANIMGILVWIFSEPSETNKLKLDEVRRSILIVLEKHFIHFKKKNYLLKS